MAVCYSSNGKWIQPFSLPDIFHVFLLIVCLCQLDVSPMKVEVSLVLLTCLHAQPELNKYLLGEWVHSVPLSAGLGAFTCVSSFHSPSSPKGLWRGNRGSETSANLSKGKQLVHWRGASGPHACLIPKLTYCVLYWLQILPCVDFLAGVL